MFNNISKTSLVITVMMLLICLCSGNVFAQSKQSGQIQYDKEGKPYSYNSEDCDKANWDKLNTVLKPKGFIAGAGGGYSKFDDRYFCSPCVKYAAGPMPEGENLFEFYKPAADVIFTYANGASYEYCSFK